MPTEPTAGSFLVQLLTSLLDLCHSFVLNNSEFPVMPPDWGNRVHPIFLWKLEWEEKNNVIGSQSSICCPRQGSSPAAAWKRGGNWGMWTFSRVAWGVIKQHVGGGKFRLSSRTSSVEIWGKSPRGNDGCGSISLHCCAYLMGNNISLLSQFICFCKI